LVLGLLLQRFDFIDTFDYELKIKTTLTIKPDEMRIQVVPRPDRRLDAPAIRLAAPPTAAEELAPIIPACRPAQHPAARAVRFRSWYGRRHRDPAGPRRHLNAATR
jgi:cytochrome P450/NADPH-cytochrome P450 reductase